MKYGLYLAGKLMTKYDDATEAYRDDEYATSETGIPHEVKVINEEGA